MFKTFQRLLLLIALIGNAVLADTVDSLRNVLTKTVNDTGKTRTLQLLSWELRKDSATSRAYANQAMKLAEKIQHPHSIALSYNLYGDLFQFRDDNIGAIMQYEMTLKIAENNSDSSNIGGALNNIGISYDYMGRYDKALEYYLLALKINEEARHKPGMAYGFCNVGDIYDTQGHFKDAISYYEKAHEIYAILNDKEGMASTLNNIGIAFNQMNDYDEAVQHYLKARKLFEQVGDIQSDAVCLTNLGETYVKLGEVDKAYEYYALSLERFKEIGYKLGERVCWINISHILLDRGQYSEAIEQLIAVLNSAVGAIDLENIKDAAQLLSEGYQKMGDFKKAYQYHMQFSEAKDSLFREASERSMIEMQTRYETEKKEKENDLLKKDIELQEKELERSQFRQYTLVTISLLIIALMIILTLNQRNFKKQKLAETEKLLSQVALLKAENALQKADQSTLRSKFNINKDRVDAAAGSRLNESDWKVLSVICDRPTTSNKTIADEVFLSVDGVKSSFKKMYDLFDVTASGRNKKIALVLHVMKLSEYSTGNPGS